jgi:hypothetical protein
LLELCHFRIVVTITDFCERKFDISGSFGCLIYIYIDIYNMSPQKRTHIVKSKMKMQKYIYIYIYIYIYHCLDEDKQQNNGAQ